MKFNNANERTAYRNTRNAFDWEVGGWLNAIEDGMPELAPSSMESAKRSVYASAMSDLTGGGACFCGAAPREMRFAGADFVRKVIDELFAKDDDVRWIAAKLNW